MARNCSGNAALALRALLAAASLLCVQAASAATPALVEAAREGDVTAVRRLLEDPADARNAAADGTTALHWAAHRNEQDMAELLLAAKADPDAATDYGITPLHLACTNRAAGMVITLLRAGADANSRNTSGESALMTCAKTGTAARFVHARCSGVMP